ncbi:MAG: hypothetical protein AB4060_02685 [Crocosphaera sp.]
MNREKYVMIGHGHILGDLIELIDANQGILTKIVQNMEEPVQNNRPTLKERLAKLQDAKFNPNYVNQFYPILIQSLEDFCPKKDEKYIIGFTGFKMSKLLQYLTETFNLQFTPLIHPSASIASNVQIGSGSIIQAGTIIASGVQIENHTFINKGVNIGSQTIIERFSSLAPGSIVGQNTLIKTGVTLGIGCVILNGIVVNKYSMVAAGATVNKDVPFNTLVAGVPAIIKKTNFYKKLE